MKNYPECQEIKKILASDVAVDSKLGILIFQQTVTLLTVTASLSVDLDYQLVR